MLSVCSFSVAIFRNKEVLTHCVSKKVEKNTKSSRMAKSTKE